MEELHAQLLNQQVILVLCFWKHLAAGLVWKQVLDQQILNSRKVFERYNWVYRVLQTDLFLKRLRSLHKTEYLVQRNEGAFMDWELHKFRSRKIV